MAARPITHEEARDIFISQVRTIVRYWAELPIDRGRTVLQRCNGVAFSILALIDGEDAAMPACDLVLAPHPSDKEYHSARGQNWFVPGQSINEEPLHHLLGQS